MKLPNNSIGISDILDYRECPQRMVYGMRRHVELPERLQLEPHEKDEPPEHTNWTNAFGSAIHHAMHLVTADGMTHEQAIHECLRLYGTYLDPGDIDLLREDLNLYERRRHHGVTLVASEMEARVPLFVHNGVQIYFRFRLDLLQRLQSNPGVFLHRDYKSSKWRKTPEEVHKDPQMWAYNWGIHELFPECERLLQTYDQLRHGTVGTTKNAAQRAQMKLWLIDMVKIIMADETYKPKINNFCRYCALVVTCRETKRATRWWRGRLSVLAPMSRQKAKIKLEFAPEADEVEDIIKNELPQMIAARKHIEHVEKLLKETITAMSDSERERLGWLVKDRKQRKIAPDGLRELHELLGDEFYHLASVSITALEEKVGKPKRNEAVPIELQIARNWTTEEVTGFNVVPANSDD